MRKKLIIAATAGVLALGGVAVAVPVLAGDDRSSAAERIREALSGLVEEGSITEEQADEVATTLSEAGIGGRGGHGGRLDLEAATTALDMTEEELRTALEADGTTLAEVAGAQDVEVDALEELRTALEADGTTLAEVAEAQGVEVDALIDALVQAQEKRIVQAVEDGRLTQEEADERLAGLQERVTGMVNSEDLRVGGHGHGGPGGRGD